MIYGLKAHFDMYISNLGFDRKQKIIVRDGIKIIASYLEMNRINKFYADNYKPKNNFKKDKIYIRREKRKAMIDKFETSKANSYNTFQEFLENEKQSNKKINKIFKNLKNNEDGIQKKGQLNFYKCLITKMLRKRKRQIQEKLSIYTQT